MAGSLSLATLIGACGSEGPDIDCSTVTPTSFADMTAFAACTSCHASTVSGTDRQGAPSSVNYDTYEAAVANIEKGIEEIYEGKMPPNGVTLDPADEEEIYAWGECGTPQ